MLQIAEQAVGSYEVPEVPLSSYSSAPIGTRLVRNTSILYGGGPIAPVGTNPITKKPVYPTPVSAAPHCDHVPTTSTQSGDRPGPTPAVGTVSPKATLSETDAPSVAPKTSSVSPLAIFAFVVLLAWFLAGASLRRSL